MHILPLNDTVRASHIPLEQMAAHPALPEEQKVGEMCRQFEAVFLRQILREAQKTVIPSDLIEPSATQDIYRDMIVSQLADSISQSGSFGLAQALQTELTRQTRHQKPDGGLD